MKTTKVTQPMKSMKVLTTLTGLFSPSFSSLNSGVTTPMPTRTSSGNASRKLASLTTLLMATLLLAACGGGGGGGGGGGASAPALATGLNSVKDGIVLTWNNPAGVRDITVIGSEYLNATSATPQRTFTHATYTNTSTDPEVVEPGSRTITITGLDANLYYSFNLTRNFDDNRTDTIVSARQYLTPSFVGVVTAALTTDKKGATLSWANPASVAGIASIRITRNEFANATASAPMRTVTTTTRDAAAIAASTTATLDITGLTANRYYTFTVTPIYAGNVEGPTSAATTPRLYLPPAIAGAVTATLDSGSAGVILSWSNPRSVLDITAISITRQEFANATGIVPLKTVTTMTTEPDALATAATLNISSGLTSDNYYTFTVSPIYSGDVVGPASSASNRVGPLQVSIDLDTLIAEPSADRAGFVTLTFSNPEGVSSVAVTSSRFTDSTTDTVAEAPFTSAFTLDAAIAPNARLDISGLTVNSYYEFAIFRNVQSGPAIAANPSERIYLLPEAISGVTAILDNAQTGISLSWSNPINAPGIASIRITAQAYSSATGAADGDPSITTTTEPSAIATSTTAVTAASLGVIGLDANRYYTFTVTPIFAGSPENLVGFASDPTARVYIPPATGVEGLSADLNDAKTAIALSWNNPQNAAGIEAISITRQTYLAATGADDGNPDITPTTESTAIATSTTEATAASLEVTGLDANRYYTFTVTPIYTGGIVGRASVISNRQYLPPAAIGSVTARLNAAKTNVDLSWDNPQNVAGILEVRIGVTLFNTATGPSILELTDIVSSHALAIASTNAATMSASINLTTVVSSNLYYEFTVTPVYAGNGGIAGPASSASNRVYVPPFIASVTAALSADSTAVELDWSNPINSLGIEEIRITRQAYRTLDGDDAIGAPTPIALSADDINSIKASATDAATSVNLNIASGLVADQYYTFTVTPVYTGNIEGIASDPSTRVGPIVASDDFTTLRASLNAAKDSIVLEYNNPAGVISIQVTRTIFTSATDTSGVPQPVLEYTNTTLSPASFEEGGRTLTIPDGSLNTNTYYNFTITRTFMAGGDEPISSGFSNIQYLPPATNGTVAATAPDRDGTTITLSWTNPQNVAGITSVRITRNEYADIAATDFRGSTSTESTAPTAIADSTTAGTAATLDVSAGLNPNSYYTFTVTPIYAGNGDIPDTEGPASATSNSIYSPPAIVDVVTAALNSAKTGVDLSWENSPNIGMAGIGLLRREYADSTNTTPILELMSPDGYTFSTAASVRNVGASLVETDAAFALSGLTANRYHTFSITPIYIDSEGETYGPISAYSTPRVYVPPVTLDSVTATLNAAKTGVTLNWSNPANVAGITSVRIIRNAYSSSTIPDFISTGATTSEAASAIASSTTEATAATADVPSARLTPNNYYDFKVNPIYTGSVFGTVSAATARVYIPPAATAFRSLRASLDTAKTGLALSWINPLNAAGITSIRITRQAYLTATGVADGTPVTTTTTAASAIASTDFGETEATFALTGLPTNRYYTYTVTPTYAGNFEGPETAPSPIRYYIPPAIVGGLTANLNADKTSVALSWNNPANAPGLRIVTITRQAYLTQTGAADGAPVSDTFAEPSAIATSTTEATSASIVIPGLTTDRYYTFTATPAFEVAGGIVGLTTAATARLYVPPATSALTATLTSDSSGVVLGWTNPTNAPGIVAIRITRQAYTAVTGGNTDGAATSMLYTASSDLMPGVTSRQLNIGENGIEADKHYEFTITPIYEGGTGADIEGLASAAPSRIILMGGASVIDLSAAASDTVIRLTWTNPADVLGISITQTSGGSTTTIVNNANTENLIRQASKAFYDVQGLSADTSYTFSVTPRYAGDVNGIVSSTNPISLRATGLGHNDLDDVPDAEDVDDDGDGLIELYNVNELNMMRDDLTGASFAGNSSGCGGGFDNKGLVIEECNGYELMAHVDLNDLESDLNISNWEPIAPCSSGSNNAFGCGHVAFRGIFDANEYNISNMRIIRTTESNNIGFFGSVSSTELRNIVLKNASISIIASDTPIRISILAGSAESTRIINSAIEFVDINTPTGVDVGGLVGLGHNNIQIISSTVMGNRILGGSSIGGMIGRVRTFEIIASSAVIREVFFSAGGFSGSNAGGLLGSNQEDATSASKKIVFSSAILNTLGGLGLPVGGLASSFRTGVINASYVLALNIDAQAFLGGVAASASSGLNRVVQDSYYNVTSFGRPPNTVGTELNAVGDQPSLQPSSFSNTGDADFTSWGQGWCDKTTGEFTQDPTSALAMSNGGANYAWDIGSGKFPVPACTPFSPETLRTAIDKVRNAENPVPIN